MDAVLHDKILGMFAGNAIGDALGMSVETWDRAKIMQLNQGQGVLNYMDPQTNREWVKNMKAGSTTDDWQLTHTVGRSLVQSGGYNLENLAKLHIEAMNSSTFGWGAGTTQSLKEIENGVRTPFEEPKWASDGSGKGSGNGILMKISPFAALTALTGRDYTSEIMDFGRLTHPDMRARIAAIPLYLFLAHSLSHSPLSVFQVFTFYDKAVTVVKELEEQYMKVGDKYFLSKHMNKLRTTDIDELMKTGVRFVAWETVTFTLGVYLRHPTSFSAAILEAVNCGGDTDTNASIVGGLVGATIGYKAIPDKWKTIPAIKEACELADSFMNEFAKE